MERGSITKWLLLGLAIFLMMTFGRQALFPTPKNERQPKVEDETAAVAKGPDPTTCTIDGARFKAELTTRGASLQHVTLKDYTRPIEMPSGTLESIKHIVTGDGKESDERAELVSTERPGRLPLRVDLRAPSGDAASQQVPYDVLDWKLAASDGKSCTFTYADDNTSLQKVVSLGKDPFELNVDVTVKNLASTPKTHRFTIEQDAYRTKKEMEGHLGRQSEMVTESVAVTTTKTERNDAGAFKPSEFKKPEFTSEKWRRAPGDAKVSAVSSIYFTGLLIPEAGPGTPSAETLVEEVWNWNKYSDARKENDPAYGYVFRARLNYPEKQLAPGESVTYRTLSFTGPKERALLAHLDHGAIDVLNLGTFATIARGLVWYLYKLYGVVGSWGWAIVLLTISVRIIVFPLSLSQIKSSAAMRKLKPEMDAINAKYKDDAAQRGLAIQELWRKNGVSNPVLGCLPMVLQMPVWWALYTALQTAVELYHVGFGPFIPDLSAPGPYLIIPIVLGAASFLQQKVMPTQGDPSQQKMMMYAMPGIYTFMMLFLPAGLGVYMLTSSVLAIGQQLFVERYLKKGPGPTGQIEVKVKSSGDGGKPTPALGKGKARVRGT